MPSRIALVSGLAGCATLLVLWRHVRRRTNRLTWPAIGVGVAPSTIPGAGDGLFALRDFAAGEVLADYYGEVLSFAKMALRENRDYIMGGFGLNCSSARQPRPLTAVAAKIEENQGVVVSGPMSVSNFI